MSATRVFIELIGSVSPDVLTAVLQSSTATALMVSSFTDAGAVDLVPALAVMLGANVGMTLIVQVPSFDIAYVYPLLIAAGVLAYRRGRASLVRDLARAVIGPVSCCSRSISSPGA